MERMPICMKIETIYRYDGRRDIYLTAYLLDDVDRCPFHHVRPALLVCPGGGFSSCSNREAEPIAMHFAAQGYQVFVLQYSLREHAAFPAPIGDAAWAMQTIRREAKRFYVNPQKVAVMGFSAGGYIAAGLSVFFADRSVLKGETRGAARPDAAVLCYPVLTAGREHAHEGSIRLLLGETPDTPQRRAALSLENHIPSNMPPVFLWHTADDKSVDVENSLLFVGALAKKEIPFDLHIFETGHHGLADCSLRTCDKSHPYPARWLMLAQEWLGKQLKFRT